eukprot:COSAG01_NODE_7425_length_3213_cov_52.478163_1_plen_107_part_00
MGYPQEADGGRRRNSDFLTLRPEQPGSQDRQAESIRAARIGFCDSRGTEVLWVGVCAPHGWNLTETSVRVKHSQVKANSTLDCRDPPNFPKVAQSQAAPERLRPGC